ncbi:hypothetical protein LTR74_018487 [Friedmanniomyces endolithicus]|nr:hypothetical protein LTR74_018487 [Friedmanniomyces endolithicus]
MRVAVSDTGIMHYLKEIGVDYHRQLLGVYVDDEGFVEITSDHEPRSLREVAVPFRKDLLVRLEAYDEAKTRNNRIRNELDIRVLSDAHVIEFTTSGLARHFHLLRKLNAKALLVEEAGEVLEAHLLTAMLSSLEHAILIGDHQQLRPKVQDHELSCDSSQALARLDISLFERLVNPSDGTNGIPYVSFEAQRRMHLSISNLIRSTRLEGDVGARQRDLRRGRADSWILAWGVPKP